MRKDGVGKIIWILLPEGAEVSSPLTGFKWHARPKIGSRKLTPSMTPTARARHGRRRACVSTGISSLADCVAPGYNRLPFKPPASDCQMSMIALEIARQIPASAARRVYSLPVTIGRGSGCNIQLPADNRAISRLHVEIIEEDGRIVACNRASNLEATRFNGRGLRPNERQELVPGDTLTIFGTAIRVLEPVRLGVLIARRGDLKVLAEQYLLPGSALLAIEFAGQVTVDVVDDLATIETDRLVDRLAVLFYFDGDEPTLAVMSNPSQLPILLDRAIVEQQAIYIRPEDTIEVGEHRFEVMSVGQTGIVCEKSRCHVLNISDRSETCRLCGTPLSGAARMLRTRKL